MSEFKVDFFYNFEEFYSHIPDCLENTALNTPFQYKSWQQKLYEEHRALKPKIPYLGAVLFQNGKPVVGGHFFIKRIGRHRGVFFLGTGGETDYFDLIYFCDAVTNTHIQNLLACVSERSAMTHFVLTQVPAESPLVCWAEHSGYKAFFCNECAWISFGSNYEDYLSGLTKSVRQNIRTANNRLARDCLTGSLKIYDETSVSFSEINELLALYENRRVKKDTLKGISEIKHWFNEVLRKIRKEKYNIMVETMKDMTGKFLAVYRINETASAYCYGLKSFDDNKICIMQVAINDDYSRYSPGMLLLSGVFRELLKNEEQGKLIFDLTNGNEKYKFSLGADAHYTNYYDFSLKAPLPAESVQ